MTHLHSIPMTVMTPMLVSDAVTACGVSVLGSTAGPFLDRVASDSILIGCPSAERFLYVSASTTSSVTSPEATLTITSSSTGARRCLPLDRGTNLTTQDDEKQVQTT